MQKRAFILIFLFAGIVINIHAQSKRFDTSMKVGKAGFRVTCNNKNADKNVATIVPIGFESSAREVSFEIKGKIYKAEADDLNNDGFPDMVIYVVSGGSKNNGTVIGVSSDKNQAFLPIIFPDIKDDQKLMAGYAGNDEFTLMEGSLLRRFPLYNTTDTANIVATGMMRQVLYRVTVTEKGVQKFIVARSYEIKKQ